MRNLVSRTLLWFVAIPAIISLILFLPFRDHLALAIVVVVTSALGASELAAFFADRDAGYRASGIVIPLLGAALPATQLLVMQGILTQAATSTVIAGVVALILLIQVARHEDEGFSYTLSNTAANTLLLIYPGLFLSYIIRIDEYPAATAMLLLFLGMVFFNDTGAYVAGMAYRGIRTRAARKNGTTWEPRFTLPVSPHKTIVGFVAGMATSVLTALAALRLFPNQVPLSASQSVVFGIAVGAATIAGDLIESALKRSATRKDSGTIIPGRGGILDSIDSVLYAAPVFYYLLRTTL